jgi:hypothetical protein
MSGVTSAKDRRFRKEVAIEPSAARTSCHDVSALPSHFR